nr:hypothetical protein [Tanacetum cinerariifolium]GFB25151.1 hypothetical protein [Tanacetum cinerariifolium]
MGDIRREMGDMQAELLALRGQPRRAGQPGGDARVPNRQDAPRDADTVSGAKTRMHTPALGESKAQNRLLDSILSISLAVELSLTSYLEPRIDKHNLLRGGISISGISSLRSTGGGMCRGGGSGVDGNVDEAVHLARRSPVKGGNSEVSGDGDEVGMARSLSTYAFGGKDMAA